MGSKKSKERELAKLLFVSEGLTQKEIAIRCEVTEKTVSRWKEEDSWDKLRRSLLMVKEEQLTDLYSKLEDLNSHIRDTKGNIVDSRDVDAIAKLTSSIKQLEQDTNVGDVISVAKKIIHFIQEDDIEFAQKLTNYFDLFIKSEL